MRKRRFTRQSEKVLKNLFKTYPGTAKKLKNADIGTSGTTVFDQDSHPLGKCSFPRCMFNSG